MTVAVPNFTVQPVRKSVLVRAPREMAFEVFTANIAAWWPLESHHIGAAACVDVTIEPRAGGRWFERGADGSECDWGRVLLWQPPTRLILAWQLDAQWQFNPDLQTEIEVSFTAQPAGVTQITLEHRGLERLGDAAGEVRAAIDSPNGWSGLLERFAGSI